MAPTWSFVLDLPGLVDIVPTETRQLQLHSGRVRPGSDVTQAEIVDGLLEACGAVARPVFNQHTLDAELRSASSLTALWRRRGAIRRHGAPRDGEGEGEGDDGRPPRVCEPTPADAQRCQQVLIDVHGSRDQRDDDADRSENAGQRADDRVGQPCRHGKNHSTEHDVLRLPSQSGTDHCEQHRRRSDRGDLRIARGQLPRHDAQAHRNPIVCCTTFHPTKTPVWRRTPESPSASLAS
jgi:hypothetical protein